MVCIDKTFVIFKGVHIQEYPSAWGLGVGEGRGEEGTQSQPPAQQVIAVLGVAPARLQGPSEMSFAK